VGPLASLTRRWWGKSNLCGTKIGVLLVAIPGKDREAVLVEKGSLSVAIEGQQA
jgi:hypothetical protein